MNVRHAEPNDLPELLAIFDRARVFMAASGNPTQWPPSYPDAELMSEQIEQNVCYVIEQNDRIEGTFCYIPGEEPTYAKIKDGAWPEDCPYATIHRLASAGRVSGVADACFDWCLSRGLPLRADTHDDNRIMQHLLERRGFSRCGRIFTDNGTPRIAYYHPLPASCTANPVTERNARAVYQAVRPLLGTRSPLLIALDGRCAAGKTTLAAALSERYGWGVVHLDDFFLRPDQRTAERLAEPGGNLDRERFAEEVLRPLRENRGGTYRVFDCRTMDFDPEPRPLPKTPVVLLEGSYACHPDLQGVYDLRVFLTVDPQEQLRRLAQRSPDKLKDFRERWIPMEERYIDCFSVPAHCALTLAGE